MRKLALLGVTLCAACGGSPAEGGGTDDGTDGSTSDSASGTTGVSDSGATDSGAGTSGGSTGGGGTSAGTTDGTGGTGGTGGGSTTGEPPHETDWGLCTIELDCALPLVDDPKRNCNLVVKEGDGWVAYDGIAGVEVRGRSSQGWPKHQYGVELWTVENDELVAPGSDWKYNDTGTPGGVDWMQPNFDDSGWSEGPAPLGYGILGPEWNNGWAASGQVDNQTTIGYGPDANNKYRTAWFRHSFQVGDPNLLHPVYLQMRADDGAVVYLNGTEIARFQMPAGAVGPDTLASDTLASLDEVEFRKWPVDNALLASGTNVIAVEVHQASPQSSDLVLDLTLSTKPPGNGTSFFEFGKDADWVLNGMYFDLSLYRNKLMYDTFTAFDPLNNYAAQGHYCEMTLNGDWVGIYTIGEKLKRDDDRIDILEDDGMGGSFILKSDVTQTWVETNGIEWQLVYPKLEDMTPGSEQGIKDYMAGFGAATAGNGNVWDYVEMSSLVDFVLVQEFTRNGDAYRSSMHIYKDVGGKIHFVPWDFDIGLGGSCNDPNAWNGRGNGHWLNGIAADPTFQAALTARWNELRATEITEQAFADRIAGYAMTMTMAKILENFVRWPIDQIIGGDDWVLIFREDCPVDTWDEEDMTIQTWISERIQWMDDNIDTFG